MTEIPRIPFDELPAALADQLRPRYERLGYLGEFFQVGAHQPEMLAAFIELTEAGKDALPANLVELVAITMATLAGNDYERNQHERLAVKLGLPTEWVKAVEALDPSGLDDDAERAAQRYLLAAFPAQGRGAREELSRLSEVIGPTDAVGVMLVAGRYLAHALLVNSVGIDPPVSSIWEESPDE
jgi:hypothetical protein